MQLESFGVLVAFFYAFKICLNTVKNVSLCVYSKMVNAQFVKDEKYIHIKTR